MDVQFKRGMEVAMRTTPYLLYRLVVYTLVCLGAFAYVGFLGLIGYVFGPGVFWVLSAATLAGFTAIGLWVPLNQVLVYFVEAGHLALITEVVEARDAPTGIAQIRWGSEQVQRRFGGTREMGRLKHGIRRILRRANRKLFDVAAVAPAGGLEDVEGLATRLGDASVLYLEQCVLAHIFRNRDEDAPIAARSGIVLYCECWKGLMKKAVRLTLFGYAFILVAVVVLMVPFGFAAAFIHSASARLMLFIAALFLGVVAKWVLYDPVASATIVTGFLEDTDVLSPDPEWFEKIETVSERFRQLKGAAS